MMRATPILLVAFILLAATPAFAQYDAVYPSDHYDVQPSPRDLIILGASHSCPMAPCW